MKKSEVLKVIRINDDNFAIDTTDAMMANGVILIDRFAAKMLVDELRDAMKRPAETTANDAATA